MTPPLADASGRDRLVWNVVASWGTHVVFLVAGFVLPVFLDRRLGQTGLGVWDFGWSLVGYFGLAQLGVGSAVNRYVAKYRTEQDWIGLNRMVASVLCLQGLITLAVLVMTALAAGFAPSLLPASSEAVQAEARWVVALLGLSVAVRMAFATFAGVISGCHRWDVHNVVNASGHAATVIGMIAAVSMGGGLRALATVHLCGATATELLRTAQAFRVCPELRLRWQDVNRLDITQLLAFGSKTLTAHLADVLLYQTNSMLVATHLGAAVLAVYARPLALIRHVSVLTDKFGLVLTPTSSSMQVIGSREELAEFVLTTARYSALITLPPILGLTVLGNHILRLWMGPRYELGTVLVVLAVGSLLPITQQAVYSVLMGLNAHGPPAVVNLLAALLSVGLGVITLQLFHGGLVGAGLALTLPGTLVNALYLPWYVCRRLNIPLRQYITGCWVEPLFLVMPFALGLLGARHAASHYGALGLLTGLGAAGALLAVTYWTRVLPSSLKLMIRHGLRPHSLAIIGSEGMATAGRYAAARLFRRR